MSSKKQAQEAQTDTSTNPDMPETQKAKKNNVVTRPRLGAKVFTLNILNGLALGIVIALLPNALLGGLAKALMPYASWLGSVALAVGAAQSAMGLIVGYEVGHQFKMTPIQSASIALAVFASAGAVRPAPGGKGITLVGPGDIITMGLTATVCVWLIRLMGDGLKSYAIIVYPTVLAGVGGLFGALVLGPSLKITVAIGLGIKYFTSLEPILMGILIAMAFSLIIMTPISSVGIGLAISLAGIGSGAGAIGVAVSGFGFCILGWRANGPATSLAHVIGSPKMSMPTMLMKPKIMIPVLCSAAVSGLVGALLNIQGTPMSAGFGVIGLVGPIAYLQMAGASLATFLKALIAFVAVPMGSVFMFGYFFKRIGFVRDDDYYLAL